MIIYMGDFMLRKDLIKTKLKEIEESVRLVEDNFPKNFEEFLKLGLVKDGIYKRVEFSIQNVLDICSTINTDLELGIPSREEEIIENVVRRGVLSKEMGKKVRKMKGFRNFLVHRYGRIEDRVSFENIKKGLHDFHDFAEEINKFLEKEV